MVEKNSKYTLYKIHSLPEGSPNELTGTQVIGLPSYIAVSENQDRYIDGFIELTDTDVGDCSNTRQKVCHFHAPVGRGDHRESCALATLTDDEAKKRIWCQHVLISSTSSNALYLGDRTWAITRSRSKDLLIQCPQGANTMTIPHSGIFELPPGCSAKTTEWFFPASLEGSEEWTITTPDPDMTRKLDTKSNEFLSQSVKDSFITLQPINNTIKALLTSLVEHNKVAISIAGTTLKEAENLSRNSEVKHRYPYEWIPTVFIVFCSFIITVYVLISKYVISASTLQMIYEESDALARKIERIEALLPRPETPHFKQFTVNDDENN